MEEPNKDVSPAQPTEAGPESAQVPPSQTPATPAHEEAERASGQDEDSSVVETDDPEPQFDPQPTEQDSDTDDDTGDMPGLPEESIQADESDERSLG